jgi:hypothetical protein
MILTTIGFILAGAALVGVLARFWDDIKNWLNTVAADAVEAHLGYSARNNMQKAVAIVDRVLNVLKNKSVIYTKNSPTDTYFDKTTITCEAKVADVDEDIIQEIQKNGNHVTQTFDYKC